MSTIDNRSLEYIRICREQGCIYIGIQTGLMGLEDLVMFNEPGGSTLGIPVSEFSSISLARKLEQRRL